MALTIFGGKFQSADGTTLAGGKLTLQLSSDLQDPGTDSQIVGGPLVVITLDNNGNAPNTSIESNAGSGGGINPSGTGYYVNAYKADGSPAWLKPQIWVFTATGGTVDLGTMVPSSISGPSFSSSGFVLISPAATQTIATYPLQVPILQLGTLSDTGISRDSAGVIDVGNGTQGDASGTLKATALTASGTAQGAVVNATTGFRANGAATSGHVLRGNGTNFVDAQLAFSDLSGSASAGQLPARTGSIAYLIDGGGSPVTTGAKGQIAVPFACTITGWTITADQSGSCVVDVLKSTYSAFPTTASIAGSDKPTISAAQKNQDNVLSGWGNTAILAGDQVQFNVNSCSTITRINISLTVSIPWS